MRIALASLPFAGGIKGSIEQVEKALRDAASAGADVLCTPENYLPGLRNVGFAVEPFEKTALLSAIDEIGGLVKQFGVALILGAEYPNAGSPLMTAIVYDREGCILGRQDKVQLDPSENGAYAEGKGRRLFEIDGLRFGVAICHEAWRYPETVRWAARQRAHLVFVPHLSLGTNWGMPDGWGDPRNSFHEKAAICRAAENAIYIAIVNYAVEASETTSAVIAPDGTVVAYQPRGQAGVLIAEIQPNLATGYLAHRFRPEDHLLLAEQDISE